MRLPTTLKALKYVMQGQPLGKARQIVKDRRLAKAIQAEGDAIVAQVKGDKRYAYEVAAADNDGSLVAQDLVLRMGQVHLAVREARQEAARIKAAPVRPALQPQPSAAILARAQASWDKAMAQHEATKAAEHQRDLASVLQQKNAYVPDLGWAPGAHTLALPPKRGVSLNSLQPTPPLTPSRRSSISSAASDLSTPSEPGIMSFWQPAELKPQMLRSGSDPDVGGYVRMADRQETADV